MYQCQDCGRTTCHEPQNPCPTCGADDYDLVPVGHVVPLGYAETVWNAEHEGERQ